MKERRTSLEVSAGPLRVERRQLLFSAVGCTAEMRGRKQATECRRFYNDNKYTPARELLARNIFVKLYTRERSATRVDRCFPLDGFPIHPQLWSFGGN